MARAHRIYGWICENGERSCYLENRSTHIPHLRSMHFVTTKLRSASLSLSAMQAAYAAINVLLDYCAEFQIDLEDRFRKREYLTPHECEALRRHCQRYFGTEGASDASNVVPIAVGKKGYKPPQRAVVKSTEATRLTEIARYTAWLARDVLGTSFDTDATVATERMRLNLLELRPADRKRNSDDIDPGLTDAQIALLREMMAPGSKRNPFTDRGVQTRNHLIIELFLLLGKRMGELLNIRGDDVDWSTQMLHIRRRPDDKLDIRKRQALVKTQAHSLPIGPELVQLISDYVKVRKAVPGARKHPYLLVTHKSGPTQGQPMTIQALQQMFEQIRAAEPQLSELHAHLTRHTWNRLLSEQWDKAQKPIPESEQENIRSNLMGWKEGSGTAKTYNKRHTRRKANEASLAMQRRLHKASNPDSNSSEGDQKVGKV